MKRPLVFLCWLQVAVASALLLLVFYNELERPFLQLDYSRRSGRVVVVPHGSPSEAAGLRVGDRIVTINGERIGRGTSPLYRARAGRSLPIVFERDGTRRTTSMTPISQEEAREEALGSGLARALWAISGYMLFPLNALMLGIGIFLLAIRSNNADARLAALVMAYWAGGSFLADKPGMGAMLAPLPLSAQTALFLVDSFFVAMFFAASLHFAVVFPTEATPPFRKRLQALPYLASLPIFYEVGSHAMRVLHGVPEPVKRTDIYSNLGPLLLIVALAILATRFVRARDRNARRRLQLIFISMLPGVLGFIVAVVIDRVDGNYLARQIGTIVNWAGVYASSLIFAYAVVRHRMFNVRVLVRRSIQYAFARGTLLALMSLPVVGLVAFLYTHRDESLASLLTGTPAVYVLLIVPLFLVIRYRRSLLEALDRRYFREQYDARQLLLHVVSVVRDGSDAFALSRVALDEIDRALHPKHVSLWQLDPEERELRRECERGDDAPPHAPPLPITGALPTLLATDADPLDLFSRHTRALVKRLPEAERDWLRECDAYLLVPLLIESRLVGLVLLGERKSEEPYSSEDRQLLRTVAAQLALTFDYSRLKGSPSLLWTPSPKTPAPITDEVLACIVCGRCYGTDHATCDFDQQSLVREEGVPRVIEDKYVISRLLGRGGMGSVYLANQNRLNRPVALKVLLAHLVGSASMRGRFEREARIVARLRHPGIVTVHDFGVLPSGHAYLVMEYLEGHTLRRTIATGAMKADAMLEILTPVAEAVDAAHRAGIIHRDLKPENIMLVADHGRQTPRVLDFGLAKLTGPIGDDEATLAQSGASTGIVGTLMYISPEVLSGQLADARSDQYSLGLIAYELVTGTHPFAGAGDLAAIVRSHTQEPPPPIEERAPHVPRPIALAIHRALAKSASERFDSVGDFLRAMEG